MKVKAYRHTKIVVTLGPATVQEPVFRQMLQRGIDVVRLNMAHASPQWTQSTIRQVRNWCKEEKREVAVLMDVKGPEIRTGDVPETYQLDAGEEFTFYNSAEALGRHEGPGRATTVNYAGIVQDVKVGDTLLVDSGLIRMLVKQVTAEALRCEVKIPGPLGKRRHINLPGVHVRLPSLTDKDKADVLVGIDCGVDYFALSFVRESNDLDVLRRFMSDHGSNVGIIAKIEDQAAIENLEEIIQACDGLMVARGDLGLEIPFEKLPIVQRRAVQASITAGKPVIVATHMLESMITQPMPTRAEITDMANAVFEQADAVMLSAETTVGKYPLECVEVINRVTMECEKAIDTPCTFHQPKGPKAKLLHAAALLATELGRTPIVVFTRSGMLARTLSSLRPLGVPIFAFTDVREVFYQLLLYRGVEPFFMKFSEEHESTVQDALAFLQSREWVKSGMPLVFISNVMAGDKIIDTIQLRWVE